MAIVGLGTDIVEIERMQEALTRSRKLAERVLTTNELAVFEASQQGYRFLAKRFAAKEAAVKALGTGIGNGISWQQMEVTNDEWGKPALSVSGTFAQRCAALGVTKLHLTLADERHYAVATVILEDGK